MTAHERLREASLAALRWFTNHLAGNARNGPSDDVFIARDLTAALAAIEREEEQEAARAIQAEDPDWAGRGRQ